MIYKKCQKIEFFSKQINQYYIMGVGLHIKKDSTVIGKKHKTMLAAINYETKLLNISAISLFVIGPMNSKKNTLEYDEINDFCEEKNINIWPHGSYTSVGIWNVNHENKETNKSVATINLIKEHLLIGKQLNSRGVVVHLSRHPISHVLESMEIMSKSLKKDSERISPFTIECPASKPDKLLTYEKADRLNTLVDSIESNKKISLDWNLCVDSAHQYAGAVDFGKDWVKWESELSLEVKNRIKLFHLNGASAKNFGTGKDGHIIPLSQEDAIWGHLISDKYREYLDTLDKDDLKKVNLYEKMPEADKKILKKSSFCAIVKWAKAHNADIILEINRGDYVGVQLAMDVINAFI
jgi:endonuclease IV